MLSEHITVTSKCVSRLGVDHRQIGSQTLADMGFACGRYGIGCGQCGLWPISSVADMVVADMVCGRYRRNSVYHQNSTLSSASAGLMEEL